MSSFGVSTAIRAIRKLLLLGSTLTLMILGAATLTQLTGVAPAFLVGATRGVLRPLSRTCLPASLRSPLLPTDPTITPLVRTGMPTPGARALTARWATGAA